MQSKGICDNSMSIKNNPTQAKLTKLLEFYHNKKFDQAVKLATSITQEFPDHPLRRRWRANLLPLKGSSNRSFQTNLEQLARFDCEFHG